MNSISKTQWVQQLLEECNEADCAEPLAIHRFVPSIAVYYGIPAALVFQYVHDRCQRSGLKSIVTTLRMLEHSHPYLGSSALYHGLTTLVQGTKKCPLLLQREQSTVGYIYCPICADLSKDQYQEHSFDTAIANRFDVVAAFVYSTAQRVSLDFNLIGLYGIEHRNWYWLVRVCREHHVYTSENTIRRALIALVEAGLISVQSKGKRRQWRLSGEPASLN